MWLRVKGFVHDVLMTCTHHPHTSAETMEVLETLSPVSGSPNNAFCFNHKIRDFYSTYKTKMDWFQKEEGESFFFLNIPAPDQIVTREIKLVFYLLASWLSVLRQTANLCFCWSWPAVEEVVVSVDWASCTFVS